MNKLATGVSIVIDDNDYFLDSDVVMDKEEVVGRDCQMCHKYGMDDDEFKAHAICHIQDSSLESGCDYLALTGAKSYANNTKNVKSRAKSRRIKVSHIKCTVSKEDSDHLVYSCSLCGKKDIYITLVSAHMRKKCVPGLNRVPVDLVNSRVSSVLFPMDSDANDSTVSLDNISTKDEGTSVFNVNCLEDFGGDSIVEEIVTVFDPLTSDIDVSPSAHQLLEVNTVATPKTVSKQSLASCIATASDNTSLQSALVYETFGPLAMNPDNNSFRHSMEESKIEETNLFKCCDCKECFLNETELSKHRETWHVDHQNNFLCLICGKSYTKRYLLKRHVNTHEMEPATCNVCNKTFHDKMMLKTHTMMHTGKHPFKCLLCVKGFIFSSSLKQHLLKEHKVLESDFPCSICSSTFKTKQGLKKHQEREHDGAGNQHLCPKCGKIFPTSSTLALHMVRHGPRKHVCEVCGFRFYSRYLLRNHMLRHQSKRNLICETCGETFYLPTELRRHMFNQHTDDLPAKCTHCDKAFKFPHRLKKHMIFAHRIIPEGKQVYSCKICNQLFVNKFKMNDHMNLHSGDRPYSCKECSRTFRTRHSLEQHTEIHAVVRKPKNTFPCDICGKKFKNVRTLHVHNQSFHLVNSEKASLFACNDCDKTFSTIWMFNRHKILFHLEGSEANETIQRHHCDLCEEVFMSNARLMQHKQEIHLVEDSDCRPFQCSQCEKTYRTNGGLYQHNLRKHKPSVKTYPCKVCGKIMNSASALYLHRKCKHGINAKDYTCDKCGRSFNLKGSLTKHKLTHVDIKDREVYTCGICFKDLTTKWSYEVHMRVHRGIKPHACDVCGRSFTQSGDRNKHRMNAHKEILQTN